MGTGLLHLQIRGTSQIFTPPAGYLSNTKSRAILTRFEASFIERKPFNGEMAQGPVVLVSKIGLYSSSYVLILALRP
jgi:hypothetical protein